MKGLDNPWLRDSSSIIFSERTYYKLFTAAMGGGEICWTLMPPVFQSCREDCLGRSLSTASAAIVLELCIGLRTSVDEKTFDNQFFFNSAQNSQRMVIVSAGNAEPLETIELSESETQEKKDFSDHRKIIFWGVSEIGKKRKRTFNISVIYVFLIQILSLPVLSLTVCFNCFCSESTCHCLSFWRNKVIMVPWWLFTHTSKTNCLGCQKFMTRMKVCIQMSSSLFRVLISNYDKSIWRRPCLLCIGVCWMWLESRSCVIVQCDEKIRWDQVFVQKWLKHIHKLRFHVIGANVGY